MGLSKKKKVLIITSVSIVSFLCLAHVFGGYVGGLIAQDAIFGHRFEMTDDAIYYTKREDYPALANREEVSFLSGSNTLKGAIYKANNPKGLLVAVHGLQGSKDDHTSALHDYFLSKDYDVFCFDLTASGESEGSGVGGLCQSAFDVASSIKYLSTRDDLLLDKSVFLGYSWGAYGVMASLGLDLPFYPKAAISFAGFAEPHSEMIAMAKKYVGGFLAEVTAWQMDWAIYTRCGSGGFLSAVDGLRVHPEISYFLVQGDKDRTVPLGVSLYQAALEANIPFTGYLREGYKHPSLWRSENAVALYKDAKDYYESLSGEDKDVKFEEYLASIGGREALSELDLTLLDDIENKVSTALSA